MYFESKRKHSIRRRLPNNNICSGILKSRVEQLAIVVNLVVFDPVPSRRWQQMLRHGERVNQVQCLRGQLGTVVPQSVQHVLGNINIKHA